jgi:itaconate CoA-transferase
MPPKSGAPLTGITVVALEQAVSAPMCTRVLADFGARVIKVENPKGGDFARSYDDVVNGLAAHFVWANRGKESVTINLKSEAGLGILHRLLDRADALVSNLAPGSTARLGLAPADLAERHPDVIALEIDGYGPGGPLSHKRAYDLLAQSEAGACAVTGYPGAPAKPGPPMADISTGLYSALSILTLLYSRDCRPNTGRHGNAVTVSLFDTMTDLMGYPLTYTQHSGVDQQPLGMSSPAVAPYGAYRTAGGQTVVLGTTNDAEWQRLSRDILQRDDLADDGRFASNAGRVAHRNILDEAIGDWCARHDLEHVQKTADAAGIGNARYNVPSEVLVHPQLTARNRWRQVDTPAGPISALLPPPVISGYQPAMGPVPGLGQHTDSVLTELGIAEEQIAALRSQGAIGSAYP